MRKILIGIALAAACAVPAFADPPDKNDPNREVCKRTPSDGDRIVRKICHTAAQWDAEAEANRKAAELFDSRRNKFDPSTTDNRPRDNAPAPMPETVR